MSQLRGAVSFLTIVPAGGVLGKRTFLVFPLVGAALGGVLGLVWVLGRSYLAPSAAAALFLVAEAAFTGVLHLDAVADCGDGLIAHMERPMRLQVMAEPTLGAFGVASILLVELAKYAALSSSHASWGPMIACFAISRSVMAVVGTGFPRAKAESIIHAFSRGKSPVLQVFLLVLQAGIALVVGTAFWGSRFAVASLVGLLAGVALVARSMKRLGGVTGDVAGASGILFEAAFFLFFFH